MDEQENILNTPESPEPSAKTVPDEDDLIPIRVREKVQDSIKRAMQDARDMERLSEELHQPESDGIVAEYEARYRGGQPKNQTGYMAHLSFKFPPQHRRPPREDPEYVTENERTWAAVAHGSALLTIAVAVSSGGIGALLTIFVPLLIYLYYRDKSEYVAHHALQAFAAQAIGIVGFMVLLITLIITWVILLVVSFLLIFVLVGLILFPVVIVTGVLALAATFIIPLGMLVYSMIAAVESWNGHNYSYPWIGDWVDDQLFGRI
ncbi:MAG TPA: DUF4870 domain-containing protein [Aggregatilineales bacterium]|nr:DUF4870 domain-containing protein [Aggregatilineales bacterium]